MAIEPIDYWYDGQQRRFLEQMVRAVSGFSYMPGIRNGVQGAPIMVPARMATQDRVVGSIMRNNSENTLLTVPMITVWQAGLVGRREDVQYPGHVDSLQVSERAIVAGAYTATQGNTYTIQRLMPRPFEMKIHVDIWTSNQEQKYQIMEQILTIIYPTFDIQNSENGLDWTALTTVHVDDITWSSRSMPVGTDSEIDVATITLRLPMWLSPPAKVKAQKIIKQIITNIYNGADSPNGLVEGDYLTRVVTTPGDYQVSVSGGVITLLNGRGGELLANGFPPAWTDVIGLYGTLTPTLSEIRLITDGNIESTAFIAGTIQYDPHNVNQLNWQIDVDTLPGNTLPPVKAILDPTTAFPGHDIPLATAGDRYMLINELIPSVAWGSFSADINDVITYNGSAWTISFDASANPTPQHMLNLYTGNQLRWTGTEWVMGIDGIYGPGYWKLAL